jgi:hypothetical protein
MPCDFLVVRSVYLSFKYNLIAKEQKKCEPPLNARVASFFCCIQYKRKATQLSILLTNDSTWLFPNRRGSKKKF